MTNSELISKVKAEIEVIKKTDGVCQNNNETADIYYARGARFACEVMLSFLDTLESETTYDTQQYAPRPSVGIEDVARVQFASHAKVFDKKRKAVFDWEQFKEVAGIFYGFGKKDRSDTLESEKPVPNDLEEAAEEYFQKVQAEFLRTLEHPTAKDCFIAGAKWQAEQDQETIELAEDHAYLAGAVNEREKMMKEAVEYEVGMHGEPIEITFDKYVQRARGIFPGDKVRVIVCKKEDDR